MLSYLLICLALGATPQSKQDEQQKAATYIKVEVKGQLTHGVVAIGGETTGTTITAKGVTFEVEVGKSKKLQTRIKELSGSTVILNGTLERREGVEIPERWIIKASQLDPANR